MTDLTLNDWILGAYEAVRALDLACDFAPLADTDAHTHVAALDEILDKLLRGANIDGSHAPYCMACGFPPAHTLPALDGALAQVRALDATCECGHA